MKKYHYWFTTENGDSPCKDFIGTYQECETYAQKESDILGETIFINYEDDIVGVVYPDTYL